ncbi:MAG: hypothetical protein JWR62_536 [Modestobacter sp.]|jgi:uncharacterized protein YlxW (UPF0749 family)|nr:hypothetical protein [Modestobacter sp.]
MSTPPSERSGGAEDPGPPPQGPSPDDADVPTPDRATPDSPVAEDTGAPPRRKRRGDPLAAALIGVLTLLLGFAFAVQVRTTDDGHDLAGAREEDLVRILDDLTGREERLRQQIAEQRGILEQLGSSDSQSEAALAEARERSEALGILNGTLPAQGPGLEMTIRDPAGAVSAAILLDAVQELRGAGAETMQVDGVRIGVSTAVTGRPGDLALDGQDVQAPYVFRVIGSGQDMATAMNIPNGVVDKVRLKDGTVDLMPSDLVVVDAVRPLDEPQYAEPADGD